MKHRKILSVLLVLIMVMALTVPALAAEAAVTEVIPCRYDGVRDFSEGLAAVELDGKWGFISFNGDSAAVAPTPVAHPSTQTVDLDGKPAEFPMYALRDANGDDTNYIKLRDLGKALGFNVGYNSATDSIFIESDKPYDSNN